MDRTSGRPTVRPTDPVSERRPTSAARAVVGIPENNLKLQFLLFRNSSESERTKMMTRTPRRGWRRTPLTPDGAESGFLSGAESCQLDSSRARPGFQTIQSSKQFALSQFLCAHPFHYHNQPEWGGKERWPLGADRGQRARAGRSNGNRDYDDRWQIGDRHPPLHSAHSVGRSSGRPAEVRESDT